jgi:DNA recombination protein RmuC
MPWTDAIFATLPASVMGLVVGLVVGLVIGRATLVRTLASLREDAATARGLAAGLEERCDVLSVEVRELLEENAALSTGKAVAEARLDAFDAGGKRLGDSLLAPLRQTLDAHQERLSRVERHRDRAIGELREQIGRIRESHRQLGKQTGRLATALVRPGTRGQWGEMTLRRLLELAGLADRVSFGEQVTVRDANGASRPDCLIRLPRGRRIVIDTKYPADAFLRACECDDQERRIQHLDRFAKAVRGHAVALSRRQYPRQVDGAADFVVMFLPGENLLQAAVERDPGLIEAAFELDVVLATPTTLLALLKTVARTWQDVDVARNLAAVKRLGGEMVGRVAMVSEHLSRLGTALETANRCHAAAVASAQTHLVSTTKKMVALGLPDGRERRAA